MAGRKGTGREGREINEQDESCEQAQAPERESRQRESRVPVLDETLVFIVLRLKNPTPKRFVREHREAHTSTTTVTHTKTDRVRYRDRKEKQHTSTRLLCGPAGGEGVRSQKRGRS